MKVGCLVNNFTHLDKRCANDKRFAHPTLASINAISYLHDTWWNPVSGRPGTVFGFSFNTVTNWGTMLPAAAITYGAMAGSPYLGNSVRVGRLFR